MNVKINLVQALNWLLCLIEGRAILVVSVISNKPQRRKQKTALPEVLDLNRHYVNEATLEVRICGQHSVRYGCIRVL